MSLFNLGYEETLVKLGFAVTEEGHKWDAQRARHRRDYDIELWRQMQEAGGAGYATPKGEKRHIGSLSRAFRFNDYNLGDMRHNEYIAKKHDKGENAWNPFGGTLTPLPEEEHGTRWLIGKMKKPTGRK